MPTARPRHTVTETDALAAALDNAARRWPADRDSRSRLLLRLVEEGNRALCGEDAAEATRRREAIARTRGRFTGMYPEGYLERLRDEWPA